MPEWGGQLVPPFLADQLALFQLEGEQIILLPTLQLAPPDVWIMQHLWEQLAVHMEWKSQKMQKDELKNQTKKSLASSNMPTTLQL